MFDNYKVRPLTPERIPEAFPVVMAALDEEVTPQRWSDYARAILGPDGRGNGHGILTLEDPQSRIVGLAVYDVRPDLQRRRVLVIENFAVVTLIGARKAATILLAAMEQLARQRDCACLAVSLLDRKGRGSPDRRQSQAGQFFQGAGFRLDLARLCKWLGPHPVGHIKMGGTMASSEGKDARP